jgi:hypothetical protein
VVPSFGPTLLSAFVLRTVALAVKTTTFAVSSPSETVLLLPYATELHIKVLLVHVYNQLCCWGTGWKNVPACRAQDLLAEDEVRHGQANELQQNSICSLGRQLSRILSSHLDSRSLKQG